MVYTNKYVFRLKIDDYCNYIAIGAMKIHNTQLNLILELKNRESDLINVAPS